MLSFFKRITVRQRLLICSFVFILAGIGVSWYAIRQSNDKIFNSSQRLQRSEQIIYQTSYVQSLAEDIETSSRGFIITNDSSFLEPLWPAEKSVFVCIKQLQQLTQDDPAQLQRVDSLLFYIHERLDWSLHTNEVRTKEGLAAVVALVATKQGKYYTDRIRHFSHDIQQAENTLLQQQVNANERSTTMFNRLSIAIFVLLLVFTILLLVALGNYMLQRKKGQVIKELNDELERKAVDRTAKLTEQENTLALQNQEKENRAAELIIANKELVFQNEEKENRAAELLIANTELAFQNKEKENRAAELIIANKELAFQNEEKEKRAIELSIANKELKIAEDNVRKLNEELEQKVIERTAQLESANKELGSFSYSVSHDLRAPLRAVHGFAQRLKDEYGPSMDDHANRLMNVITINTKKMGQLIDDLLAFSRIGRKELVKRAFPMQEMVANICAELKNGQRPRDIQFNVGKLQAITGDSTAIKQVWVNLISNAVKYSGHKEKAIVEIGCENNGNEVIYHVKDNGAGFDMRYADKLFGVFQRLHDDEEFEGTGVGLAIVHRIVTKHGGRVWGEGKVNVGATFYFTLNK